MVNSKKTGLLMFILVITISLLLAACGSNSSSGGSSSAPTGSSNGGEAKEEKPKEEAKGEDVAAFYEGKRLRFIVPYDPGGGYDEYVRMLSPYIEKYTGTRVEVVNLPGAGGMRGVNELWRAPKDGLTIGHINGSAMVTNELAGIEGAAYKIAEFGYLGRVVDDLRVLTGAVDGDYEDADALMNSPRTIRLGATGLGGSTYVDAVLVAQALGLDQDVLHGFDSSGVVEQVIIRGDVDGMWGSYGSAMNRINEGIVKPLMQSGVERSEVLPDIPTTFEMAKKYNVPQLGLDVLEVQEALNAVGRPVAAPPGIPQERLEFLREAFEKAMNDPEFIKLAEERGRDLNYASGEDLEKIIEAATNMSDEVREIILAAVTGDI